MNIEETTPDHLLWNYQDFKPCSASNHKKEKGIFLKQGEQFKAFQKKKDAMETKWNGLEGYTNLNKTDAFDLYKSETLMDPTIHSVKMANDSTTIFNSLQSASGKAMNAFTTIVSNAKQNLENATSQLAEHFIYVNKLPELDSNYDTCVSGSKGTYIGDNTNVLAPSVNYIKNGRFDMTTPGYNDRNNYVYDYIKDGTSVPYWNCTNTVILTEGVFAKKGNANEYSFPFPYSKNIMVIQNKASANQIVHIETTGDYLLYFHCVGRYSSGTGSWKNGKYTIQSNGLSIQIKGPLTNSVAVADAKTVGNITIEYTKIPQTPESWATSVNTIHFEKVGSYQIIISGTNDEKNSTITPDACTAITDVVLCPKDGNVLSKGDAVYQTFIEGESTLDTCTQAAYYKGIKQFSLKNVNPITEKGFCYGYKEGINPGTTSATTPIMKNVVKVLNPGKTSTSF